MNKPVSKLPIHFKKPGRSYSQIARKGNVALYSVYSDYLIIPDFALPYLLIGYELVVIKIKNNCELYPASWQFGKIAWSIPKRFKRSRRTRPRRCRLGWWQLGLQKLETFLNRSTSAADCACPLMAPD